jgi:hypothetical protein
MEIPTRQDLVTLAEARGEALVSIYMPTHRAGAATRENPIRFKNLLSEAEERLVNSSLGEQSIETLLASPRRLIDDYEFWQNQLDGLALFGSPRGWAVYRTPLNFPEESRVGARYYLKPLISLLSEAGVFYTLGLSANQTRLLRCTTHTEERVDMDGMPESMADALWADDPEKQLQFRSAGVDGHVFFHGAGGSERDVEDEYLRYFRRVDTAISPFLKEGNQPLVLACVDYLAPIYREANTYPGLIDGNVGGSPDRQRDEDLRENAWQVLQPVIEQSLSADLERYGNLLRTGKTSDDPAEVALAAHEGRIDTIFVDPDVTKWGSVDAAAHRAQVHDSRRPGDEDLLDIAVATALTTDSTIHAATGAVLPDSGVAAIFRY